MNVMGELIKAQMEQIAGATATPAARGRFFANITSPLAAVPMFYDGTTWQQLAFQSAASSSTIISQNSGKACTVDWSTGVTQRVVLTDNAVISFSNPQTDLIHTLIIAQNNTSFVSGACPIYNYRLNMLDQALENETFSYQPTQILPIAKFALYRWVYKANVQTGYATIPSQTYNPQTAPLALITGMDIHPDGDMVLLGGSTTPFANYYPISSFFDGIFQNPFGLRNLIAPTAAAGATFGMAFSPNRNIVFYCSGTSPFIQGFFLDRKTGVSTAIANPGTLPAGAGNSICVHPSGMFVAIGHATTPFMSVYPVTGAAYGTKLTDPVSLPPALVTGIAFSPTGDYLAIASRTTPFIKVYPFTGTTPSGVIGTAATNPSPLPADGPVGQLGKGIAWRPQGDYIAMAMASTPFIYVVPFNRATGAFGTPLTVSGAGILAQCNAVQWSPDGQYLIVVGSSPGLYVIDFSAFTIGTPISFDGSSPGAQINDLAVHPSGDYIILGNNTAQATVYTLPRKARNYLRIQ